MPVPQRMDFFTVTVFHCADVFLASPRLLTKTSTIVMY